jgi:hypothetical protein
MPSKELGDHNRKNNGRERALPGVAGSRALPGKVPAGHLYMIVPTGVFRDALLTGNEGRSAVSDDLGFLESIEFFNSMKEVS